MAQGAEPDLADEGRVGLQRYRAVLAYDGGRYHGWARQPGLATIEQAVLDALDRILRGAKVQVTCAGRTDAGVHALGQVLHIDTATTDPGHLLRGLNAVLPADIRFRLVEPAAAGFDARFAALWRHYRYRITDGIPDPLTRHLVVAVPRPLDCTAMDTAVQQLLGEHDFGSFCKPRPGATTIREVLECRWRRQDDSLLVLDIRADAFCHSMVRSVVGASLIVGSGRRPPQWFAELRQQPSRQAAAPVAPPHGLVLMEVGYPPAHELAQRALTARAVRGTAGCSDCRH